MKVLRSSLLLFILSLVALWSCRDERKDVNIINVGAILPLTGDKASFGKASKNGIDLALEKINIKGINGKKLNVIFEDSKGQAKESVNALEKLISKDKVKIVIGPISSPDVLKCAPIAEKNKVILMSPGASSPEITGAGDYIFRNVPSDVFESSLMADFIFNNMRIKKICVIYINTDYGVGVYTTFRSRYSSLGGTITFSEPYNESTRDFKTILSKTKSYKPEAIYFVGYKELGVMIKQAKELNISCQYFSTAIFEDPDILSSSGGAAEGLIFTSITFDPASEEPRAKEFVKNYSDQYGKLPDGYAAVAYDATLIIADVLRRAGVDTQKIKDTLYSVKNFPGLLGNFGFDKNGDVVLPIKLKKVINSKFINLPLNYN